MISPRPRTVVLGLVVLGIALRAYHYFRDPSVWHDEAALIVNVLALGFRDLLGPLHHAEAGPPLFLWLERAAALLLGDSTFALRLLPFLASCLTLVLVTGTARRELWPAAVFWAVLLLATSDRLLWHACEAKPYALDAACAATVLALFSATRPWPLAQRLAVFLPLVPLVIGVSYPGCFVCGGLLLAMLPAVWRSRCPWAWVAYLALGGMAVGSFALVYFGPIRAQRCELMDQCWTGQFPRWDRPWTVPLWTVGSTADVFRYCFLPCGSLLLGFAAIGALRLARSGQGDVVTLAAAPLGLNLVAAYLHGYPYGGARVVVHAAPGLALLTAAGVPPVLTWLRERCRFLASAAGLLLLLPLGLTAYRVAVPWDRADSAGAAAYVLDHRSADEPVYGNHWEYEYLFRGIGGQFRYLTPDTPTANRAWVVLTSAQPPEREAILAELARDRRLLERRDFAGAIVARLDAPGSVAVAESGSGD